MTVVELKLVQMISVIRERRIKGVEAAQVPGLSRCQVWQFVKTSQPEQFAAKCNLFKSAGLLAKSSVLLRDQFPWSPQMFP